MAFLVRWALLAAAANENIVTGITVDVKVSPNAHKEPAILLCVAVGHGVAVEHVVVLPVLHFAWSKLGEAAQLLNPGHVVALLRSFTLGRPVTESFGFFLSQLAPRSHQPSLKLIAISSSTFGIM